MSSDRIDGPAEASAAPPEGRGAPRARSGGIAIAACLGLLTGCGSLQRHLIFEKSIPVPEGRFAGPITIDVPRRAARNNRDFEIRTELHAACDPLLRVSFPDGEIGKLGEDDADWQALLARRAAVPASVESPSAKPAAPGRPPVLAPGHWESIQTESWPGQRAFLAQRQERCGHSGAFSSLYLNAFDESGQMTFWAETPQEIAQGSITVRIYELIDAKAELKAEIAARKPEVLVHKTVDVHAGVDVSVKAAPPRPPPKKESPPPAGVTGAIWVPGYWVYMQGEGHWVWMGGHWDPPAGGPPSGDNDSPGQPPNPGCTWARGHWQWEPGPGEWTWLPGHWNAPPPLIENPGTPPVPESQWVSGTWISIHGHFEWSAGYWDKPRPRAETPPPPPYAGARWVPGVWISIKGTWVWSPGYYERSGRPPPAPRAETPPPSPAPGSVWLSGFWRWSDAKSDYEWVSGHWERPPGEGYVWVADPPAPGIGVVLSGHWELRVKVDGNGSVKVHP